MAKIQPKTKSGMKVPKAAYSQKTRTTSSKRGNTVNQKTYVSRSARKAMKIESNTTRALANARAELARARGEAVAQTAAAIGGSFATPATTYSANKGLEAWNNNIMMKDGEGSKSATSDSGVSTTSGSSNGYDTGYHLPGGSK